MAIDNIRLNGIDYPIDSGLTSSLKDALMFLASNCGWQSEAVGTDGYNMLYAALYDVAVTSISVVVNQTGAIYLNTDLSDIRKFIAVIAHYENGASGAVTGYSLTGELTAGDSSITVGYAGKTATATVNVRNGYEIPINFNSPNKIQNNTQINYSQVGDVLRVYTSNNNAYASAMYTIDVSDKNYTYVISADADIVTGGPARIGFRNTSTDVLTWGSEYSNTDGHLEISNVFTSDDPTSVNVAFFATWSTTIAGDVSYSNIKVAKYIAEGD